MSESIRTCAGCGRKAPQWELQRFVAKDGALTPGLEASPAKPAPPGQKAGAPAAPHGRRQPGRGVYTCRRLACFERAAARRAFARVLRQPVRLEPSLTALYTDRDG